MLRIEFHDREKEIREIRSILNADPILITFIYGPINSGKTELINHLARNLPTEYRVFYVNLRGRFVKSYEEFLDVLFEIDEEKKIENAKKYAEAALADLSKIVSGIPIPTNLFEKMFEKRERSKDAFKYIENFFVEITKKYIPVLIIDELQVIGDIKVDDLLIYKLFNFFVRLTKELHLAHVFAITSDSLFIEEVFSEAMLQGRSEYLLVDDFDKETAMEFLSKYNFKEEEKSKVWYYCGGKPVCLLKIINVKLNNGNIDEKTNEMFKIRKGQIEEIVYSLEENNKKMFENMVKVLIEFKNKDKVNYKYLREEIKFLVKKNIIFADPVNKELRTQSTLDLLAIRDVLNEF